jgi:uncharacterized repeat protein (TIGR01451 family)
MSDASGAEAILICAKGKEKEHDWLRAVECYRNALGLLPDQDFSGISEICDRSGYAFYRAAFQAENNDGFRETMQRAIASYEKAKELYGKLCEPIKTPRMLRCDAMIAFIGYWLATRTSEKKRLLDDCWRVTKEALNFFREAGEGLEYGKIYNQLSICAGFACNLELNCQTREGTLREAIDQGEKAVTFLSTSEDLDELARSYVRTATFLDVFGGTCLNINEKERCHREALRYWMKASELSKETALVELLTSSPIGEIEIWGVSADETLNNLKEALQHGKKTGDRFIVGCALDLLAFNVFWKAIANENPNETVELAGRALQYAEEAKRQFEPISFVTPRSGTLWVEAPHAEYYWLLSTCETDLAKRLGLLEKALGAAPDALRKAEASGYPEVIMLAHRVFSKVLASLARMQTSQSDKRNLLEKGLVHGKEALRITEQFMPLAYWYIGVSLSGLANTKSELAELADDPETKKNMLQEAMSDKEKSLRLCLKDIQSYEKQGSVSLYASLGGRTQEYGYLLNLFYALTRDRDSLRKAAIAFEEAAESFQKLSQVSRVAECHWKAAQAYDMLGQHSKAAERFAVAASNYEKASEKVRQLKSLYQDHALYMQAWNEIEKAKYHHAKQDYGLAIKHFEKAANLHKSLKQWSYLAPNYLAWAKIELGEDLSRKDQSEESKQAFEQAAKLFVEARGCLEAELNKMENPAEKQMVDNMFRATNFRREYCEARMAIEDARILEKRGDHYSSSEKYCSAAETLEKMTRDAGPEQWCDEIKYIIDLSRAWEKMMLADAKDSPQLYLEASRLFEQASEHSSSKATRFLTLGLSHFCKALEAGTKFTDTRNKAMHLATMQHLQSATNYYQKAGLENVAEYARATGLLFDAYVHMDNAKKEMDPEKKTRLYRMAEVILQASAGSYMKAGYVGKREQVVELLEKVKEERELAIALTEVLHAPTVVSSATFPAPIPTYENAVGLERFDHAEIRANIVTSQKELRVGENLNLDIELVNAGKGPALLVKITDAIPRGFEIIERPETYRVEDGYLSMRGKRLDPMKTEEVRLVAKAKAQGTFPLRPKILYLDENGKYKTHEPEPIAITVKELGIKGWLKGER